MMGKIKKTLHQRGLSGTAKLIAWKIGDPCVNWLWPARYQERRRDREFDAEFGVETRGIIGLEQLQIESCHAPHGVRYEQTKPAAFDTLMKPLQIRWEDFIFVDFGSGKGRALMLASEYPFRRIIGVEFARELHAAAQANLAQYRSPTQRCHAIELHCQDAAEFVLPAEPTVFYFYNPFDATVMNKVLANMRASLAAHPRPAFILYCNHLHRDLVLQSGFREIKATIWYSVFRHDGSI
jgi:SAM-dependent methyltransferase